MDATHGANLRLVHRGPAVEQPPDTDDEASAVAVAIEEIRRVVARVTTWLDRRDEEDRRERDRCPRQ